MRWDNLIDTILLTRDLAMEREANVVRDNRATVAWFRRFAETVDEMGAPTLP